MKAQTIKNAVFLLVAVLMIFARSLSAQTVLNIDGNISDLNGSPIANHDVYFTLGTNIGVMSTATTDANGYYNVVITSVLGGTVGILYVSTEDCNNTLVINTHYWSPNITTITSDFIICAQNTGTPCTLFGAYVNASPNGLSAGVMTMPPTALVYTWSNGTTGYWSPYYTNWCVQITDTMTGCDTTICDTSAVSSPCSLNAYVQYDPTTNTLNPVVTGGTPPYSYTINNGGWLPPFPYTPGWCITISDAVGCDTIICDTTSINQSCIDTSLIDFNVVCPTVYNPVCGCDSVTYVNPCEAENYGGVTSWTQGPCGQTNPSNCQADFIWYPDSSAPGTISFYDLSTASGSVTSWLWDFGDGTISTLQNPTHTYQPSSSGMFTVCLTITSVNTNGSTCTSVFCDVVYLNVIGPGCYADFYSNQVGASDTTFFTNTSSGTTNTTSYFWDFGDGNTSTDEHPTHLYAQSGWYYVCLTIMDSTNNCYNTYCDYLNIIVGGSSGCQAYFYGMPSQANPNGYDFFDYSSGNVTNWLWDFGDGTTSTLQNPTHTYANTTSSFYLVCLTIEAIDPATGTIICTDTYCDGIMIFNQQSCIADFYAQDLGNNTAQFTNNSYPLSNPQWGNNIEVDLDYGDGTIDYNIGATSNHVYANAGTYYACITITETDSSGNVLCTDTYCDSVTVTSGTMPCQANFCYQRDSLWVTTNPNGTITNAYMADVFYFCDLSTPVGMIQSWQWDMGDGGAGQYLMGTSDTSQMPVYEYDTTGTYVVCLSIITYGGQCSSTTCDTVLYYMMQSSSTDNWFLEQEWDIFPNPVKDQLGISLNALSSGDLAINIMNIMGQVVYTENTTITSGLVNKKLNITTLSNGVYTVELMLNGNKQHKRVVISR